MAIYTKNEVRKMLKDTADFISKVADDYAMGKSISASDLGKIRIQVKIGLSVLDGSWDQRLSSSFPKRK
jgi:hypothetical protein